MHPGCFRALVLATSILLCPTAFALEVTFRLVPAARWNGQEADLTATLPEGRVFLYRVGEYEPTLVFPANRPTEIPAGTWRWIAEAPGYVTVDSGAIAVGLEGEGGTRSLVWPVFPACELVLSDPAAWRQVQRLDVVSTRFGSVYPIDPRRRTSLWVPAGEVLAYSTGARGLLAIRSPWTCVPGERQELAPPQAPPAGRQDLMVHLRAEDLDGMTADDLLVYAEPPTGETLAPAATVSSAARFTRFFLGIPAVDGDVRLIARHPKARTAEVSVRSLGGSVRELEEIVLEPRPSLSFQLDYRPAVEHRRAVVELQYCGQSRKTVPGEPCPVVGARDLVQGVHRYTFPDLDDGQYIVSARVDDELVHGLGQGFFPMLPEAGDSRAETPFLLREEVVHGHLLVGGDPVSGSVVLAPHDYFAAPVRRFPTGEDLEYRLTYFGRRPFGAQRPDSAGREPEDLLGLYVLYTLSACDRRGRCRTLHPESILVGSGRLDLELGRGRGVDVEVIDATNGRPIEDATVYFKYPQRALIFDHGEIAWRDVVGGSPPHLDTDALGLARLRGIETGAVRMLVHRDGYERYGWTTVELAEIERIHHRVALRPAEERDSEEVEIRFSDGRPAVGSLLLGYDERGRRIGCAGVAGRGGQVAWRADHCAEAAHFLLLHGSAIAVLDAGEVMNRDRVEVDRAPRPLVLRVTDDSGRPFGGLPVELRYGSLSFGENELLSAHAIAGQMLFRRTDRKGELVLRGIDPTANEVPELYLPGGEAIALSAYRPGDLVEVVIDLD